MMTAYVILAIARGNEAGAAFGEEVYWDAAHRCMITTRFERNRECAFDHERWFPQPVGPLSCLRALALGRVSSNDAALETPGGFVVAGTCSKCGKRVRRLRLRRALERASEACPKVVCGGTLIATIRDSRAALRRGDLTVRDCKRPLEELGVVCGDVLTVVTGNCRDRYFYDWLNAAEAAMGRGKWTVVVVGCGNIGSHLVPHVARMEEVGRLVLVDPDEYAEHNLAGQAITAADVGARKVDVQARVAAAIRPDLAVVPLCMRIEDVPHAALSGAIVASGVDSRAARLAVNAAAWRVAACWIDAAVDESEPIARVIAYQPGDDTVCMECSWGPDDRAAVEQVYPCAGDRFPKPKPRA